MSLQDVVRDVAEDFVARNCPALVQFGKQYLKQHSSPNRVVFVPAADTFDPALSNGLNPRCVYTRNVGCDVAIWAQAPKQADAALKPILDQDVLDALINQTALSLYTVCSGQGVTISGGDPRFEAVVLAAGGAYALHFTIEVPIVDIDFPDLGISAADLTWDVESGVTQDVTVTLIEPT